MLVNALKQNIQLPWSSQLSSIHTYVNPAFPSLKWGHDNEDHAKVRLIIKLFFSAC